MRGKEEHGKGGARDVAERHGEMGCWSKPPQGRVRSGRTQIGKHGDTAVEALAAATTAGIGT